jgi:hypothetical protein
MPRSLAACGTFSAYKRHCRRGELVDAACSEAARVRAQERRDATAAASVRAIHAALGDVPLAMEELDELEELRVNLRLVIAAQQTAPASSVAALSTRRQELVAAMIHLERARPDAAVSRLDELLERRSRRSL